MCTQEMAKLQSRHRSFYFFLSNLTNEKYNNFLPFEHFLSYLFQADFRIRNISSLLNQLIIKSNKRKVQSVLTKSQNKNVRFTKVRKWKHWKIITFDLLMIPIVWRIRFNAFGWSIQLTRNGRNLLTT